METTSDISQRSSQKLIGDLYKEYYGNIYSYILVHVKNKETAENLTQNIFLRLLVKNCMINQDTITSFIYVISRNAVRDYFRTLQKRRQLSKDFLHVTDTESNDCEEHLNMINLLELETLGMDSMTETCRRVYTLSRFKGMRCEEISEAMDMDLHRVDNYLYYGRKKMRDYIKKCI